MPLFRHLPFVSRSKHERLRKAAADLAAKVEAVQEYPEYKGFWNLCMIHRKSYGGPIFTEELNRLKKILEQEDV